jgi:hypothetical protein
MGQLARRRIPKTATIEKEVGPSGCAAPLRSRYITQGRHWLLRLLIFTEA